MSRKSVIYLGHLQQKRFIREISEMSCIFHERVFASIDCDYETELHEYEQKLLKEFEPTPIIDYDGNVDYELDLSEVEGRIAERYYLLKTTQYRIIAMWLCCLCEVWEQQLQLLLKIEQENRDLLGNNKFDSWDKIKNTFCEHKIDFEKFPVWPKLNELRLLVNVIKHGEGKSEKALRSIRPDLFIVEKYDRFSFFHSSLITKTLNLIENDIDSFANAIIEFWECFPINTYLSKD